MKEGKKVLFITQEMFPYLPESDMANICRYMPQFVQESGNEMRAFMPKFGCINERRNMLHEVIRLSGMNIIINDTDHPLIIKVASIQSARMQIYFIDNEDYFKRKATTTDENNNLFDDNDERTIFFARGVIETVKKLRWKPDIVHCHGWMTSLIPLYLKHAYNEDPYFSDCKIITSLYEDNFDGNLEGNLKEKILLKGIKKSDIKAIEKDSSYQSLIKLALSHSDGAIFTSENISDEIKNYTNELGLKTLTCTKEEDYKDDYLQFYNEI
ncbi:MAG: glycogen/starch synthase [Paludibacteraceae bacterium]|nr:glycogen/starch synthase [Paludibacteraceae bacterium]